MNYYLVRFTSYVIFKLFYSLKVYGSENLPKEGFIIASNHGSLADPPLIGASLSKPVYFMAKKELFDIPFFGALIKSTHAFPVKRGRGDIASIKKSISLLKSGKAILVFPQGSRKKHKQKVQKGLSLLAHKAGVPVVPSRIVNNEKIKNFNFKPLKYIIGKPLYFPKDSSEKSDSKSYEDFANKVMDAINQLSADSL